MAESTDLSTAVAKLVSAYGAHLEACMHPDATQLNWTDVPEFASLQAAIDGVKFAVATDSGLDPEMRQRADDAVRAFEAFRDSDDDDDDGVLYENFDDSMYRLGGRSSH